MRRKLLPAVFLCALLAMVACSAGSAVAKKTPKPKPQITVQQALKSLLLRNRISQAQYQTYLNEWAGDLREESSLTGWRKQQLSDVTTLLHDLAASKQMTAPRLPVLFLTLHNNAQYWKTGKQLVYADRVEFPGSYLEWEYYPGYGLELQVLGTFGEANGFYEAGKASYPKLVQVLNEMEALAVPRAGGIAWEYYFEWEDGAPGWVSAMAQATGIEALTNGYLATGDTSYLTEAHDALPLLETAPPTGVEVTTPLGARFLQYSFAPNTDIINAFLQTLIGLYDYQQVSHDPTALNLFNLGNAQAQSELPSFVVAGWSLYQPGQLDNLNYHELVTGFAQSLCKKLQVTVYCDAYVSWEEDLLNRPTLSQVTTNALAGKKFNLAFTVSAASDVGITLSNGSKNYIYKKILFRAGTHTFAAPKLKPGLYTLAMSATTLAGRYTSIASQVEVCKAACPDSPEAVSAGPKTLTTVAIPSPVTTSTTPTTTTTTPTTTSTTPTTTTTSTTSTTGTTTTAPTGGIGI
jgi:hypothetical protein